MKHLKEFEYYYSLGTDRSCELVAKKFNKSPKTIEKYSTLEKWGTEVKLRDRLVLELARQKAVLHKVETVDNYRKIIKASIAVYVDKLKKGAVEVKSIHDIERLMRLDMDLINTLETVGSNYLDNVENVGKTATDQTLQQIKDSMEVLTQLEDTTTEGYNKDAIDFTGEGLVVD